MLKTNSNNCKTTLLAIGFLLMMVGEILSFPQSTRFSDKQAVLTDGQLFNTAASLNSRFGGDEVVPNSIGYYPYASGKVPYLISNPYPQVSTIYGVNTVRDSNIKPGTENHYYNGRYGQSNHYHNGGFGY